MGKNKDFNENEGDLVQLEYEKREKDIQKDVKFQKQVNRKNKTNNEQEYTNVLKDIIDKYGSTKVKEEHLIKKHLTTKFPSKCFTCNVYKIQPYDFLTASGIDTGRDTCSSCMAQNSKKIKDCVEKNKIDCPCGMTYYATELNICKHEVSNKHINGVAQLKIKGLNKICKIQELRKIASLNKIYNYYSLKMEVIIAELVKLDVVVIPDEFK